MNGFFSGHIRYLSVKTWNHSFINPLFQKVDNVTIETDPGLPAESMPQRRGFSFINAMEVIIANSLFQNNQNFVFFNFANIPRNPFYNQIVESYLTLENITTINNTANFQDQDTVFFSLFIFYSPMKPFNALINKSYFYNNTNCKSFIY